MYVSNKVALDLSPSNCSPEKRTSRKQTDHNLFILSVTFAMQNRNNYHYCLVLNVPRKQILKMDKHLSFFLRARGRANLPFYLLIKLLHREACLVSLQIRLVSDKKLRRMQRRKYLRIQARVFANWAAYQHHQSARRLLKACAHLSAGPKH